MFIQIFSVLGIIIILVHLLVFFIFPKTYLETRKEEVYNKANEISSIMNGKEIKTAMVIPGCIILVILTRLLLKTVDFMVRSDTGYPAHKTASIKTFSSKGDKYHEKAKFLAQRLGIPICQHHADLCPYCGLLQCVRDGRAPGVCRRERRQGRRSAKVSGNR